MTLQNLQSVLSYFTGTEGYYKYLGLNMTDGTKYLADNGAAWLLTTIASLQYKMLKDPKLAEIQFWELVVTGSTAVLTCSRDEGDVFYTENILYTDFPEPGVRIWVSNGVALLPSEY